MTFDISDIDPETLCEAIELIPINTSEGQSLLLALDSAAKQVMPEAYERAKKEVRKEHPEYYMRLIHGNKK